MRHGDVALQLAMPGTPCRAVSLHYAEFGCPSSASLLRSTWQLQG